MRHRAIRGLAHRGPESADARIIDLLARRSPAGIEALYECHGSVAYAVALRVLGDEAAAQTVVQETLLSIWRGAPDGLPGRGGMGAWLCTMVRTRAIAALPGRDARSRQDGLLDLLGPADGSEAGAVAATPGREQVGRALAALPGDQRRALELSLYAGYSQTDISEMTGVPLATVRGTMRLALRALCADLEPVSTERSAG